MALDIFFENARRYLTGRPLGNRVDPARGYRVAAAPPRGTRPNRGGAVRVL